MKKIYTNSRKLRKAIVITIAFGLFAGLSPRSQNRTDTCQFPINCFKLDAKMVISKTSHAEFKIQPRKTIDIQNQKLPKYRQLKSNYTNKQNASNSTFLDTDTNSKSGDSSEMEEITRNVRIRIK